ncbi:hypothetical protein AVEN_246291-1 [Araneus ventricosus]|uniref:Uncharacterized protein n=1 Tax=Araneus ventricosus TaxID=182803 RepID=A0A4Y2U8L4_ARAVE|nr:hypothetical protein AVEN_246291-1 [Araneus ventricosus]
MNKFKRPMPNRNKAIIGSSKGNQEPKAKFKLFAVPKQSVSKCKNSEKGASSDISVVVEMESPLSKTVTTTMIDLRGVKPKEFAKCVLISAETALRTLGDMLGGKEVDFTFDFKEENLPEPGCSKDSEPQRRYPKRNVAKKYYKEENVPSEDEFLFVTDRTSPHANEPKAITATESVEWAWVSPYRQMIVTFAKKNTRDRAQCMDQCY